MFKPIIYFRFTQYIIIIRQIHCLHEYWLSFLFYSIICIDSEKVKKVMRIQLKKIQTKEKTYTHRQTHLHV